MRHIQIKVLTVIVTILLSVSSYGQMQQVLRNGFVAATDDGVWYLQDGFSEWVRLETSYDMATSISFNKSELGIFASNYTYTNGAPRIIYGNKLGQSWAYSSGSSNAIITNKFKKIHSQADAIKYNSGPLSSVYFSFGFSPSNWYYGDTNKDIWRTDIASDNDSIFIVSCKDNDLVKYTINYVTENVSNVSISGLHSRPTDSHQICYNPDDDEFIIVSDSGIVYSYDKTTLTTVDTIDNCYKVRDMCYGGGYVYLLINDIDDSRYKVVLSSDLTTWISSISIGISLPNTMSCAYSNKENKIIVPIMVTGGSVTRFYDNEGVITNAPSFIVNSIFDLDYINYLP